MTSAITHDSRIASLRVGLSDLVLGVRRGL
jgi:hypothetical protein